MFLYLLLLLFFLEGMSLTGNLVSPYYRPVNHFRIFFSDCICYVWLRNVIKDYHHTKRNFEPTKS